MGTWVGRHGRRYGGDGGSLIEGNAQVSELVRYDGKLRCCGR